MEVNTILGDGCILHGNLNVDGSLAVEGTVIGDLKAASISISKGARVQGDVTACEVTCAGAIVGRVTGDLSVADCGVVIGSVKGTLSCAAGAIVEGPVTPEGEKDASR